MLTSFFFIIQFFFSIIIGLYFFNLLRSQNGNKSALEKESKKELFKLSKLRQIKLTEPLSEKTRPTLLKDIVGQEKGIKSLRAALCGPNPQHVIIYGPPGIGKTAAARLILEEAKKFPNSPFDKEAKFIEVDATILRFDDRGIADPLIGSVHDPIYQGAGAYGAAGVPQPKPGAVTKAHGGVLFIDEIGELHPVQMNKLLKVLEDRKVFLESAYYSAEDNNIPRHIHEIFQKGLPADFRLIGATTRSCDEIPPALRSRCMDVFFRPLCEDEIGHIAKKAAYRGDFKMESGSGSIVARYAQNGRDAVNIIQTAGSIALIEKRERIYKKDIEWVLEAGKFSPRIDKKVCGEEQIGLTNGLAVYGNSVGTIIEIENTITMAEREHGKIKITGIVEKEEIDIKGRKLKKISSARASVENVLTVMKKFMNIDLYKYDIHLNFPGSIPIDGPSAGAAIFVSINSSVKNIPVKNDIAITGEISIRGKIKPVGGVSSKIEAAERAGVKKVLIPKENWQDSFNDFKIEVIPVQDIFEVMEAVFNESSIDKEYSTINDVEADVLVASAKIS